MQTALPNFVIIGAMKCGTSTLHEQLARQPGIFMSEPKEPNFFSNAEIYAQGEGWYRSLFAANGGAALRGESSTHYTKLPTYPQTITRMRALLPQLKLIYLMRHPIDRLVSHYIHEWSMRVIGCPIDEALEAHPELVAYSCYHEQLQPFFEAYGRDNVLPVFLERMHAQPQSELERVCRFLSYQGSPRWIDDVAQQNVSSERLRLGGLGRKLFEDPRLAQLRRAVVPQFIRDALKERLTMKQRPELSAPRRGQLVVRFDADLAKLGAELGTELRCSSWKERVLGAELEWKRA
ncbi:MAG TPA: sulfotransferase domain-containing protein [Polyangiales bacterium]